MQYKFPNQSLLMSGQTFDKNSPREILQYALGGMLYMPANRTKIVEDILSQKHTHMTSLCLDLEDAIGDNAVEEAIQILKTTLTRLHQALKQKTFDIADLPLIFVRVRTPNQLKELSDKLPHELFSVLTGFNFPKFDRSNLKDYLQVFTEIQNGIPSKLYFNPILESQTIMNKQNRLTELHYIQRKLSAHSDSILNIRVGATDFCNLFGLRRKTNQTIYDIRVVTDCFTDIINIFGANYTIAGPVWEYFESPTLDDASWKTGLRQELALDKLNGFFGKTAIHPSQLPIIAENNIISEEDYQDALSILGMNQSLIGVTKSSRQNKMNEGKTHINWAQKIITQANIYGVKKE